MSTIPIKNTKYSYGLIAILLHWIVALAFISNYAIIYYQHWFVTAKTDLEKSLFSFHTAIGVSVFVFIVLRVIWKFMNPQPKDVPGTKMEQMAQ